MGLENHGSRIDKPDEKPEVERVGITFNDVLRPGDKPQRSTDLFDTPLNPGNDKRPEASIAIGGMVVDNGPAPILKNTASYVSLGNFEAPAKAPAAANISATRLDSAN